MADDLHKAEEDHLSFRHAFAEAIQMVYTLGPEVRRDAYHVEVLRTYLTRSLAKAFDDVQDEISAAFAEYIPATEEWTPVVALPTIMKIVSRSSNRLLVGLPLCRNSDYRDMNIEYTVAVAKAALTLNMFPNFLRPLAAHLFTNRIEVQKQRAMGHLKPLIEARLQKEAEHGKDWFGRPNDVLSWCLDIAEGQQRTVRDHTMRILTINFAATFTTSPTFTQVLFNLAANPSFVPALREEVDRIISEQGCTKASLQSMVKVDSFVKESLRTGGVFSGVSWLNLLPSKQLVSIIAPPGTMDREVMKDFTFSNGAIVPKGNSIAVANYAIHHNEEIYSDPSTFDGFRFSRMREERIEEFRKHQLVSLSHDYIVFGYGRHACPGRAFAVDELKAFLAHVLLNYDVAFENNGPRPVDSTFGLVVMPDLTVSVMFRKRRSEAQNYVVDT
ncbi:hypothetical protein DXG01_007422 [Tephrocybe rancida]|nr:hypothetical protein DXG01_007422 [Tephrocybe rancida]